MESLVTSPAAPSANGATTNPFPTIDPLLVVEYLAAILETNLGATRTELEDIGSLLSKSKYSDTIQRCTRFAAESQQALYVQKDLVEANTLGDTILDSTGKKS